MSEPHVREQLSAYLDNAVDAEEKQRIENHLSSCADCRQIFMELKSVVGWMKQVPKPLPRMALETRLAARLQPESIKKRQWLFPLSIGSLVTAVIFFLIVGIDQRPINNFDSQPQYKRESQSILVSESLMESEKMSDKSGVSHDEIRRASTMGAMQQGRMMQGKPSSFRAPIAHEMAKMATMADTSEPVAISVAKSLMFSGARRKEEKQQYDRIEFQGVTCAIKKPGTRVIRGQQEWNALLKEMGETNTPTYFPELNFSNQMVVAAFMGEQSSTGFAIQFSQEEFLPKTQGKTLVIQVRKSVPPPGVMTAAVMTQPFCLKILPRFDGPIEFE